MIRPMTLRFAMLAFAACGIAPSNHIATTATSHAAIDDGKGGAPPSGADPHSACIDALTVALGAGSVPLEVYKDKYANCPAAAPTAEQDCVAGLTQKLNDEAISGVEFKSLVAACALVVDAASACLSELNDELAGGKIEKAEYAARAAQCPTGNGDGCSSSCVPTFSPAKGFGSRVHRWVSSGDGCA